MSIDMKDGKCPICWNFGKEIEKRIFHCKRCDISFNEFSIVMPEENIEEQEFWN